MVRATLRDVAARAGVHTATASRALNPQRRALVDDATAERVRRAAAELGYSPNSIARSLKTSRSRSVGVVIPDLTNPLFPPIVRGIEDVLTAAGYSAMIVNTDNNPDREAAHVTSLRGRQVEGMIFATARLSHPLLERLAEEGVALVLLNRKVEGGGIPSVTADDAAGIAMAMRHLTGLGHRRIAHLAGPQWTSTGVVRLRAYRHALADAGLPVDDSLVEICDYWTVDAGAKGLRRLLDSGSPFTALLAGNDLLAVGAYDALEERGLSCPRDLSVVGFNDIAFIDKLHPALTTVRIPQYQIGAEAARVLLERIEDPTVPAKSVLLPPSFVERQSTRPLRRPRR